MRSTVFRESGRFAGWPANYGMWAWGDEVLVGFIVGWMGRLEGVHARDTSRPFVPMLARSLDGGLTWAAEPFSGVTPGSQTLSADEHVDPVLAAGGRLTDAEFVQLPAPIDFLDTETIVLCARTGLASGARSWFYVSTDRGQTWNGPCALPSFGLSGVAARTDIVPLSSSEALWFLTAAKSDGTEGRVFAVHTKDGGRSFEWKGWVGPEPEGWSIMPSSVKRANGVILSALRCSGPAGHWIDLYAGCESGSSWSKIATPAPDTGYAGNPPALLSLLDGHLVLVYGARKEPFGLRYVISGDDGATWSRPVVLTDDTAVHDMGYPRAVLLDDGSVLACYYSNDSAEGERFIEAIRWEPNYDRGLEI